MTIGKFVENTVKAIGTATKVGVEIGADLIGIIAEKASDDPGEWEKYSKQGKEIGRRIKSYSNRMAETGGNAAEGLVKKSVETYQTVKVSLSEYLNETLMGKNRKKENPFGMDFNKDKNEYNKNSFIDSNELFDEIFIEDVKKINEHELKEAVDSIYYKFSKAYCREPGFGEIGAREFAAAIILAVHDSDLTQLVNDGIGRVFSGELGPIEFSRYMDMVVERSNISSDAWNDAYRYIKENHGWLSSHPAARSKADKN